MLICPPHVEKGGCRAHRAAGGFFERDPLWTCGQVLRTGQIPWGRGTSPGQLYELPSTCRRSRASCPRCPQGQLQIFKVLC